MEIKINEGFKKEKIDAKIGKQKIWTKIKKQNQAKDGIGKEKQKRDSL